MPASRPRRRSQTSPAPHAAGADLVDMDEAIAILKTTRPTFYRWLRAGQIKGMKVGRQWRFYRSDLERFLTGAGPRIDPPAPLGPLLNELGRRLTDVGVAADNAAVAPGEEVAAVIDRLLRLTIASAASDVHLDADSDDTDADRAWVRIRIDGLLQPVLRFDARLLPLLIARLKGMAACDVNERTRPQDGRIRLRDNAVGECDVRACFIPAHRGEVAALRLLRRGAATFSIDSLGFPPRAADRLRAANRGPWGLVVVTAPTGEGKTSTLYAMLAENADPGNKLMTVEDPVELDLPGVVQVPIKPAAGVTFASAIRSVARSAPNIVMVGEIRDAEVMGLVTMLALTGHLVLTALHADDAATALVRMLDLTTQPHVVADAAKLIVAQRLVRRLCEACAAPEPPTANHADLAARLARAGGVAWDALPQSFRRPVGCARCGNTGYRGRLPIVETLEVTPEIGAALRRGTTAGELRTIAIGQGMVTMAADGVRRAAEGVTTMEELMRVLPVGENN